MRSSFSFASLLIGLVLLGGSACAHPGNAAAVTATNPSASAAQTSAAGVVAAAQQTVNFIQVEGADLRAKLDAAAGRARAARTPYWSAYSFDVRPGVAVDPSGGEFHGSMNTSGGTTVFVGTSRGMTVETRNLAVFLLREAGAAAVTRMEIYNLDRKREYSGYPVYWLGRAGNEESLTYLRGLAEAAPAPAAAARGAALLNQHATLAVALHDDPRVAAMLKGFVKASNHPKVRSTAVHWIGRIGGETQFLADLVRNEGEDDKLRRQAAHAIGESRDRVALSTLQSLYEGLPQSTPAQREVKRGIIHAVSDNENREGAAAFLLKVAGTDADKDSRRTAVHALGGHGRDALIDELMTIFANDREQDVRRAVLHALKEIETPRARGKILEIARTGNEPGTRRHAIHLIGERAGKRSLDLLRETAESSSAETQVQMQAVHAISERPAEESVPLLIKIARTHTNQQVRRRAIHVLGESGDPRALEFFREVLKSERE
ncbi:MAG TPA: HEAT repeat domain-containing protein [Pyrinomonadaceae bacterium]|nr:HEAT repeat domain-containing protein [Pyrinomonadaceae bacterium]